MARKKIKKIAEKIWKLEKNNTNHFNDEKMLKIARELSLQELLEVDEYIMDNLAIKQHLT